MKPGGVLHQEVSLIMEQLHADPSQVRVVPFWAWELSPWFLRANQSQSSLLLLLLQFQTQLKMCRWPKCQQQVGASCRLLCPSQVSPAAKGHTQHSSA